MSIYISLLFLLYAAAQAPQPEHVGDSELSSGAGNGQELGNLATEHSFYTPDLCMTSQTQPRNLSMSIHINTFYCAAAQHPPEHADDPELLSEGGDGQEPGNVTIYSELRNKPRPMFDW